MLKVVHDVEASNEPAGGSPIDEIVRDGARQMLAAALQAEVAAYVEQFKDELDEHGRRPVVGNGFHAEREVTTAAGAIPVRAPRVNDKRVDEATGERKRFGSAILPAWARKSPRVAEVLPLLYLHGLSSSDFAPALTQFLGTSHGLSAATITRLTKDWQDEATAFNKRSLADTDYVYLWVDGIHLEVRLEQDKVCLLVMIGVRADGTIELVALTDGHRESSSRGPTCSGTASAAAWLRQCSPSATERSGSGPRCVTSSPPPASNAAGSTRSPTSSTRSQVRPATVACRQRTPPRRSRAGRSPVRQGPPGRTSQRIRRRSARRMTGHPPVLTIAHVLVKVLQRSVADEKASASCRIHRFPFDAWVSQGCIGQWGRSRADAKEHRDEGHGSGQGDGAVRGRRVRYRRGVRGDGPV
jgi:Transposase, Mutator family